MDDKSLFRIGEYKEIIKKYKGNEKNINLGNLYWLCRSYYKMEDYKNSMETYKLYKKQNPQNDVLKNTYLWCIYKTMSTFKENREELLKRGRFIVANCKQENYSPYENTVDFISKYLKEEKVNPEYREIYEWIKLLSPELLSKEPYKCTILGKETEIASKYETWYSTKSKCEVELELHRECIKTCNRALETLDKFHSDNYIWFKFKIAKSLEALGQYEKAKDILKNITLMHKHFIISAELAGLLLKAGENDDAMKYYYVSLLSPIGAPKNKVNIIETVGDILLSNENFKDAKLNYLLAKKIREEEEWKVDSSLKNKISRLSSVNVDSDPNSLFLNCKKKWNESYMKSIPLEKGTIINILNNKRGGFIKYNGQSIYFNTKNLIKINTEQAINKEVTFNIVKSYNKKKKEFQDEAINIRVV